MFIVTIGTAPAQARETAQLTKCSTKQSVTVHLRCAKVNIRHGQQLLRFLKRHRQAGTIRSRRSVRSSGRYLVRYGRRHLRVAISRTRPAHYYGWLCIHNGEGAWNANTGNGFFGGLQAHYGWGGIPRMDLLSPMQQMWVAEREAGKNGFSYSWMRGQWPNTFPPCANYF